MAFGLIQWLISFAIFLIVLTVITWSAVHLGMKDQNSTNINTRFLLADYLIERENISFHSTITRNSTSRTIENIEDTTLFANDQGSEIPNSAEFYKILETFLSTKYNVITTTEGHDITTMMSTFFIVNIDSRDKDNTTNTLYITSEKSPILVNHQNISEEMTSSNYISQKINSTINSHGARFFNTDRLPKSDSYGSDGMEFIDIIQDDRNETSNVSSPAFSFVPIISDTKQSNIT